MNSIDSLKGVAMGSPTSSLVAEIQRDSKRWTQFHTSIFPELYMKCD